MKQAASEHLDLARKLAPDNADVLLALAVEEADSNFPKARYDLLRSSYRGNKEAMALLAYTYTGAATTGPASFAPPVAASGAKMAPTLERRLIDVTLAGANSLANAVRLYHTPRVYYSFAALCEAPDLILVPGDWEMLAPPRMQLSADILRMQ